MTPLYPGKWLFPSRKRAHFPIKDRKICLSFVSKHGQKGKKQKTLLLESLICASETVTEFEKSLTQCLSGQGKWWLYFMLTQSFISETSRSFAIISASDLRRQVFYSCMCSKDKDELLWFTPAAKTVLPIILSPLHWALSASVSISFMLAANFIWLLTTYRFSTTGISLRVTSPRLAEGVFKKPPLQNLHWLASPVCVPSFVMSMLYILCFCCVQKKTISCSLWRELERGPWFCW